MILTELQASLWGLYRDDGSSLATFNSFLSVDYRNSGQVLNYPVEANSFASYNKVESPLELTLEAGAQGNGYQIDTILKSLDEAQKDAVKLTVATPPVSYLNMTLREYSYSRTVDNGSHSLIVRMGLVEVREVETNVTTTVVTKPKNPTSSTTEKTGKAAGQEVPTEEGRSGSLIYQKVGKVDIPGIG